MQKCDIAVVRDNEERIVAFANLMPNPYNEEMTIDLMRFDRDLIINGTMDFICCNITSIC